MLFYALKVLKSALYNYRTNHNVNHQLVVKIKKNLYPDLSRLVGKCEGLKYMVKYVSN